MMGQRNGKMDEYCGKCMKGDQLPQPNPTLTEGQIWAKMVAHSDLKTQIKDIGWNS